VPVTELTLATGGGYPSVEGELPLPPLVQPTAPGLVQRSLDLSVPPGAAALQRAEQGEAEPEEETPQADLDDLARKIYPIIRRMLAVERERRLGR